MSEKRASPAGGRGADGAGESRERTRAGDECALKKGGENQNQKIGTSVFMEEEGIRRQIHMAAYETHALERIRDEV